MCVHSTYCVCITPHHVVFNALALQSLLWSWSTSCMTWNATPYHPYVFSGSVLMYVCVWVCSMYIHLMSLHAWDFCSHWVDPATSLVGITHSPLENPWAVCDVGKLDRLDIMCSKSGPNQEHALSYVTYMYVKKAVTLGPDSLDSTVSMLLALIGREST